MELDVEKVLSSFGLKFALSGKRHRVVSNVAALHSATVNDLSFCSTTGNTGVAQVGKSSAGAILCHRSLDSIAVPKGDWQTLYFLDNPRLAFVKVLTSLQEPPSKSGVSPHTSIHKDARIGKDCFIGEFVTIGPNCIIGDKTIIYDNVSLVQNCVIGANCSIQSGSRIGSDGFAFERDESGNLIRFPHRGYVRIGDNVEISANCSVARGSLSDTLIMSGTKLDALVHVAHNVIIGHNCELTAGTIIGGSTTIGNTCWTGLNSTIKNKLRIGRNVIIASGASVIRDIEDEDIVAGVPAKSIKHKVTTDEVFLMAGQRQKSAEGTAA
jgi:UDP-3-O-[3-hydroxymyristoyl] glucosamine N-acyltransferase